VGEIIYKTLIRLGIFLLVLWFFKNYFDEKYFLIISLLVIYFFIFHPAYLAYKKFTEESKNILTGTLCSSCKHFDESAILCTKYDKHPTENYLPCEGNDWEPK
jgi:hypothetical protein